MEADVILNGERLELRGNIIGLDNEFTSQGNLAGFSFFDRTKPTSRFVLYANNDVAHIYTDGKNDIFSLNKSGEIISPLVALGTEITSKGVNAGFSFFDRANPDFKFVLYASNGSTFLYNDKNKNILNIDQEGNFITINKELTSKGANSGFAFFDRGNPNIRFVFYANEGNAHIYNDQKGNIFSLNNNAVVCKTTDFIIDNDDRRIEGHKGPKEMRRALVHDIDDSLTINYEKDYPGGVYIQGKIKVEELYGYPTNAIICRTTDLILDSEERRSEGHKSDKELRRALVHDTNDGLTINYGGDYPQGVKIEGSVSVTNINVSNRPDPFDPNQLYVGGPVNLIDLVFELRDKIFSINNNSKGLITRISVPDKPVPNEPPTQLWEGQEINLIDIVFGLRDKDLVNIKRNKEGQITKIVVENRLKKGALPITALSTTDLVNEVFNLRDEVADLRERLARLEQKVNQPEGRK